METGRFYGAFGIHQFIDNRQTKELAPFIHYDHSTCYPENPKTGQYGSGWIIEIHMLCPKMHFYASFSPKPPYLKRTSTLRFYNQNLGTYNSHISR